MSDKSLPSYKEYEESARRGYHKLINGDENENEDGDENESGSGSGGYEKKRKQRLEENKKKMEQLNLHHLSQAVLDAPIKPKRPYVKKPKVELPPDWQPRRSSRMSDKSLPSYKECEEVTTRGDYRFVRREDYYEVEISDEKRLDAIVRAEKLESSLGSDFPTFIKPLLHSHVNRFYFVKKAKVELPPVTQPRRSSRMSDKSLPSYKEYEVSARRGYHRFVRREGYYEVEISDEKRLYAIVRAEKLESSLGSDFPTFIKPLHHSHVNVNKQSLCLPTKFCKTHLPNQDQMLTVVDEDGHKWCFKYTIKCKHSLSGCSQFVNHHQFVDGDVLVFQLVEPATFKVYIIRGNACGEDGQQGSEES